MTGSPPSGCSSAIASPPDRMPRADDRLARGLVAAAVAFILIALAVAITGGGSIQLGGNPASLARSDSAAAGRVRCCWGSRPGAGLRRCLPRSTGTGSSSSVTRPRAAAVLSIAAVLAAFHWGAFIAGGSDSYCYLNQAELLARGAVHDYEPLSEDPAWPGNPWSFAPAGHIPMGAPAPALVPICPAGYPLLMAGARRLAGRNAMFWITPLMGGLAVYLAFLLGRRLAGSAAGLLTAALTLGSPTFLIQLFQPMNDVTAAASGVRRWSRRCRMSGAIWRVPVFRPPGGRRDYRPAEPAAARGGDRPRPGSSRSGTHTSSAVGHRRRLRTGECAWCADRDGDPERDVRLAAQVRLWRPRHDVLGRARHAKPAAVSAMADRGADTDHRCRPRCRRGC